MATYFHLEPPIQNCVLWNAGRAAGTKCPLTQKQIGAIRFFHDREEQLRDRALFDLRMPQQQLRQDSSGQSDCSSMCRSAKDQTSKLGERKGSFADRPTVRSLRERG